MDKTACRYCEREALWIEMPGQPWRLYDLDPVPTATCAVPAVVLSRRAGWRWASATSAEECYPAHRCPQYLDAEELGPPWSIAADVDALLVELVGIAADRERAALT